MPQVNSQKFFVVHAKCFFPAFCVNYYLQTEVNKQDESSQKSHVL